MHQMLLTACIKSSLAIFNVLLIGCASEDSKPAVISPQPWATDSYSEGSVIIAACVEVWLPVISAACVEVWLPIMSAAC